MAAKNRLGDRREHLRYDVSGQLWGSLDLSERVVLRNIAPGGALIEARLTPGMRSVRAAQILLHERGPQMNVIVRHMSPLSAAPDEDRYLVGVEFVNLSAAAQVELDQFVRDWDPPAEQ